MKIFLLLLGLFLPSWLFIATPAHADLEPSREYSITTHESPYGVSCALDEEGVKCWIFDSYGELHEMQMNANFAHPKSISASGYSVYVADDAGIHALDCGSGSGSVGTCGESPFGKNKLSGGYAVAAQFGNLCVLKAGAAECSSDAWGWSHYAPPSLKNPRQIAVSRYHACVLDDDGLKCWGPEWDPPATKNAKALALGSDHGCVLDEGGVQCWGSNTFGQIDIPPLKHPTSIAAGEYSSCAADEDGLHCWGKKDELPAFRPESMNIRVLAPKCWSGSNGVYCLHKKETKVASEIGSSSEEFTWEKLPLPLKLGPSGDDPFFHLSQFSQFLDVTVDRSVPLRAKVLDGFRRQAKELEAQPASESVHFARYLVAFLARPVIESAESKFFLDDAIPAYRKSMGEVASKLAEKYKTKCILSVEPPQVPDNAQTRIIALRAIGDALIVATDLFPLEDKDKIALSLRALGQAREDPMNDAKLQSLLVELDSAHGVLGKLSGNAKTAFLVEAIDFAANWLKEKTK